MCECVCVGVCVGVCVCVCVGGWVGVYVPHLHSLGPVTELSPQEKVVQHGGIHDKENLCVC